MLTVRKFFSLLICLGLFLGLSSDAIAQQSQVLEIELEPAEIIFSGSMLEDINSAELDIDISDIPSDAEIKSAELVFVQKGTSDELLRVTDKYSSEVIDIKSLSIEGEKSADRFQDTISTWHSSPDSNFGLLLQVPNLEDDAQVTLKKLRLFVEYSVPDEIPAKIKLLDVTDVSRSAVNITWTADEKVIGQIEYGKTSAYSSNSKPTEKYRLSDTISLENLSPGITYHFRLGITDRGGNITYSKDITFTTSVDSTSVLGVELNTVPASVLAPPNITALEMNPNSNLNEILIRWQSDYAEDKIDGFIILRALNSGVKFEEVVRLNPDETSFIDANIEPGETYYYAVRVYKENKQSELSDSLALFVAGRENELSVPEGTSSEDSLVRGAGVLVSLIVVALVVVALVVKLMRKIFSSKSDSKKGLKNVLRDPAYYSDDFS